MSHILMRSWWVLAVRGVLAICFGLLAAAWPAITLQLLVALFAAYALIAGAVWVFGAVRGRAAARRWWLALVLGVLSLAAGTVALLYPGMTLLVLILLMGANALVTGVFDLALAVQLRKVISHEWLLVVSGIASALFGLIVLMFPTGAGMVALVFLVCLYATVSGILLLALAFRLRVWARLHQGRSSPAAG
jgi:uncharacterized membrane protein HdeD (DUF308 family)